MSNKSRHTVGNIFVPGSCHFLIKMFCFEQFGFEEVLLKRNYIFFNRMSKFNVSKSQHSLLRAALNPVVFNGSEMFLQIFSHKGNKKFSGT